MLGYLAGEKAGIGETELAEVLGLRLPLVKYHLRVLQSAELVTHVEDPQPSAAERYVVSA
jgi:predicted transcriptional regulator